MEYYKKKLFVGSSVTAIGAVISAVINFFLYLLLIRSLSFSEYGIYASLFATVSYFTFFSPGLSLYFVKLGSLLKNHYNKHDVQKKLRTFSLRVTTLLVSLSLLYIFFSIIRVPFLWFVAGLTVMTLLQPMVAGLLQGLQEFTYLSGLTVLSTVLKAIGVFVVISFFYSLNNVLIAILGSIVIIYFLTVILFKKLSDKIPTKNNKAISSVLLPNFWQLTLVTLLFNSLINADILLARRFLISIEAGMYALQMNLARSVLLVPSTLAPIMYSLTSETAIKKEKGSSISNQTIVVTIILGIGAVIFLKLFSQTIFTSIFNKSISLDNNHVWIMALAMTMYGLSDIMIHYLLSQNKTSILVPLFLISMTQVILILFNHHSIFEISMIILLINGLLFFCSFLFYTEHIKKAK